MKKRRISAADLDELEASGVPVKRPKVKPKPAPKVKPTSPTSSQELIAALDEPIVPESQPQLPPLPTLPAANESELKEVLRQGFEEVTAIMQEKAADLPETPKTLPSVVECEVDILGREKEFPHQATGYKIRFIYPN